MSLCNPSSPTERWEVETEGLPRSSWASYSQAHCTVAETRRILPQQGGRRQLTPERCLLTSTYTHT